MRTNEGKPSLEVRTWGDEALAEELLPAFAAEGREERLTHGFHTYPAGLHPDTARAVVERLGDKDVFDPFCGGGTVLIEAMAAGRRAFGADISPTALRVASTRTRLTDEATRTAMRSAARKMVEQARQADGPAPEGLPLPLYDWYGVEALRELSILRAAIEEADPVIRPLLRTAFSAILVKVSWRRSDTSHQRQVHRRPAGTTAVLFHKKVRELGRRLEALEAAVPPEVGSGTVRPLDADDLKVPRHADLVLTSPPYPSVYDYVAMQHLRTMWFDDAPWGEELGARASFRGPAHEDGLATWHGRHARWIRRSVRGLGEGGWIVVVVGDGLTREGAIDTFKPTTEAIRAAGGSLVSAISLARPDHARRTARWEHLVVGRAAGSA